jgi:hypothetical protein
LTYPEEEEDVYFANKKIEYPVVEQTDEYIPVMP